MLSEGKRGVSQTMEFTPRLRSAIAPRTARGITRAIAIMLAGISLFFLTLNAGGIASSRGGANGALRGYALGVSAQQFSDGGYFLSGRILGYGGSYIQHALIE
jgi:hypothetical protein